MRDLEFFAYPVLATQLSIQVFQGACVLDSVITIDAQFGLQFTLFDSFTNSGRIVMHQDQVALPRINMSGLGIKLTGGLFLAQPTTPCNWLFVVARL